MVEHAARQEAARGRDAGEFAQHRFRLTFTQKNVEAAYRSFVIDHTLTFCRIAWGMVVCLGGVFALLDGPMFPEHVDEVRGARASVIAFAMVVLAMSFGQAQTRLLAYSSALFVFSVGIFCVLLTGLSDPDEMSPYFTGIFFAFAGVFTTAGLGFASSLLAMLATLVVFDVMLLFVTPVSPDLLVVYNFFLPGIIAVFGYASYLVEQTSRSNYVTASQLRTSLDEVKQLSGLLPICAACKKVRDDDGYWSQIEVYITERSEAMFSHGMCPECDEKWYADLDSGPIDSGPRERDDGP